MKIHSQLIKQKGLPAFVVIPHKEYLGLLDKLEDIKDIEAVKEAS